MISRAEADWPKRVDTTANLTEKLLSTILTVNNIYRMLNYTLSQKIVFCLKIPLNFSFP